MCESQTVLVLLLECLLVDVYCVTDRGETGHKLVTALDIGDSLPYSTLQQSLLPLLNQLTAVRKDEWGRDGHVLTEGIDSC
jgi:hypothetical protein